MAKKITRKRAKKNQKTTSLFLGVVVIIAFLVAVNPFFTGPKKQPKTEKSKPVLTVAKKQIEERKDQQLSYQVKKNDNLSKIAKNICGNKSAWILLAEKNNLTAPYILHEGETLTVSCNK